MIYTHKVYVTDLYIENGIDGDCHECPIALALVNMQPRYNGYPVEVSVMRRRITFRAMVNKHFQPVIGVHVPRVARDFINRFDARNGRLLLPFNFEIKTTSSMLTFLKP